MGVAGKLKEEKPLLKVSAKPMIERILIALKNAKKVDEVVVAVSKHTPKTTRILKRSAVKVLETPGKDYISDKRYVLVL